jgi:hypothetical protein
MALSSSSSTSRGVLGLPRA